MNTGFARPAEESDFGNGSDRAYMEHVAPVIAPEGYEARAVMYRSNDQRWSVQARKKGSEGGWGSCASIDSNLLPSFILDQARKAVEATVARWEQERSPEGRRTAHEDLMADIRKWGSE